MPDPLGLDLQVLGGSPAWVLGCVHEPFPRVAQALTAQAYPPSVIPSHLHCCCCLDLQKTEHAILEHNPNHLICAQRPPCFLQSVKQADHGRSSRDSTPDPKPAPRCRNISDLLFMDQGLCHQGLQWRTQGNTASHLFQVAFQLGLSPTSAKKVNSHL